MGKVKPKRNGQETRESIIQAAIQLTSEKGFGNTTMQAIAERVGVTSAAVFWHFESKKELLMSMAERVTEKWREGWKEETLEEDARRKLEKCVDYYVKICLEEPHICKCFLLLMMGSLEKDSTLTERLRTVYRAYRGGIARILAEGRKAGAFLPDIDPDIDATSILATMDGIFLQSLMDPDKVDFTETMTRFRRSLLRTVCLSEEEVLTE